ncbi:MAG: alpha/beta hydrolase [Actinomycetota bacterium]|nr:alpha/beta hydrolase [Actinomycetota bacterium]
MIALSSPRTSSALLVVGALLPLLGLGELLRRRRRQRALNPAERTGLLRRRRPAEPAAPDGVVADDGARLHVEIDEVPGAPVTVVFVHGYTVQLHEFDPQRQALRGRARVVLYDQRGHGRSGWGDVRNATITQLGKDLGAVLDRHAPTGPVVLVGHSLGGMTVLALARLRPDVFGSRVRGVFLLATSARDVLSGGLPGLLARGLKRLGLLPAWLRWLRASAPVLERLRRRDTKLGYEYVRHFLFARGDEDEQLIRQVQRMVEQTPMTIAAAFYPTFFEHDETAALPVLRTVPVTILVGDGDETTPVRYSREMADALGRGAEFIVVPGAGHSVNLTRPQIVDDALLRLIDRAVAHPSTATA